MFHEQESQESCVVKYQLRPSHSNSVQAFAINEDESYFASCSNDQCIAVWEQNKGTINFCGKQIAHELRINSLSFIPESN